MTSSVPTVAAITVVVIFCVLCLAKWSNTVRRSASTLERFREYTKEERTQYARAAMTFAACLWVRTLKENVKNNGKYDQDAHEAAYVKELYSIDGLDKFNLTRVITSQHLVLALLTDKSVAQIVDERVKGGGFLGFFEDAHMDALPIDRLENRVSGVCRDIDLANFNRVTFEKLLATNKTSAPTAASAPTTAPAASAAASAASAPTTAPSASAAAKRSYNCTYASNMLFSKSVVARSHSSSAFVRSRLKDLPDSTRFALVKCSELGQQYVPIRIVLDQ